MHQQDPEAFTSEGSINPQWTQHINDRDALTSEIAAYFLSGEKLKLDVNCLASECVLKSRTCKFDNKDSKKVEYNPMMLCFFCNQTFHTACYDLDSYLIREETVPWKCNECRRDLLNKHCQAYYTQTKYKDNLLLRRSKLLLSTHLPESEEDLGGDLEFSVTDINSFERRAVAIMAEEDPESVADITAITPLLLKRVMKSKSDKKASIESAERYRLELEQKVKEIEQLKLSMNKPAGTSQSTSRDETNADTSVTGSPSFSEAHHSSRMSLTGSDRTSNSLIGHYIGQDRLSDLESSTYQYRPQDISRRDSSTAREADQNNTSRQSQQLTVDQSDLATLVARLASQNDKKEERKLLEDRRKAMPKMIEFSGEESKWLNFKRDVERYRQNCQYDDETVKTYMRGALKGEAYLIVRDILEDSPIDDIMEHLKRAFGDEMRMVRNRSEDLRNFKFGPVLNRTEAVKLQVAIQSYFAACNYAKIGYINTNIIAEAIFYQFSIEDRQRCREYYEKKNPGCTTIVMNVQTIYDYLMSRMPLLDDVPVKKKVTESENKTKDRGFQMHSTNWTSQSNEDYKFEIKDKNKAIYIGYDLDMVDKLSKECGICASNDHFTIECPQYKEKSEKDRLKLIFDKKLCRNCILTTSHQAKHCDVKVSCGYKVDKTSRCCAKHHISIHRADLDMQRSNRDKDFRSKSSRAKSRTGDTSSNSTSSDSSSSDEEESLSTAIAPETTASASAAFRGSDITEKKYDLVEVGCTSNADSPRTVKVFRVKFWSPKGYVTALAIGDSGSEVTLMRDDLRQKLELSGAPHTLHLQWADKTTKTCNAMQFDIQIQGTDKGSPKVFLKDCFALKDLNLPKRTLNMESLREQFPNLRDIPFEGYEDEDPVMLIGSPHANLIEGCELVENGESGPVALKTKIGWTVYGGSNHTNNWKSTTQEVSEKLEILESLKQIDALKDIKGNKINENCDAVTKVSEANASLKEDNDKKLTKELEHQFCPSLPRKSLLEAALLPSTVDKLENIPKSQLVEHNWELVDGNRKIFKLIRTELIEVSSIRSKQANEGTKAYTFDTDEHSMMTGINNYEPQVVENLFKSTGCFGSLSRAGSFGSQVAETILSHKMLKLQTIPVWSCAYRQMEDRFQFQKWKSNESNSFRKSNRLEKSFIRTFGSEILDSKEVNWKWRYLG